MAVAKMVAVWLAEYCCKMKYHKALKAIFTGREKEKVNNHNDINSTRLSLMVLHNIIVSKFEIPRFFTAISIVNEIFDVLPPDLVTFKLYAKVTTGLKILALFDMLKNGNKMVLPKLNEFFPRTGIDHPKAEKQLSEKLGIAQLRFRKFLLSLIANKAEQMKYLQNGYKQEYGQKFQEKVKDLVLQFIDAVEEELPATKIEKLMKVEAGRELHKDMSKLTSPVINLMLDILYEKNILTEENILELLQTLESTTKKKNDIQENYGDLSRDPLSDKTSKLSLNYSNTFDTRRLEQIHHSKQTASAKQISDNVSLGIEKSKTGVDTEQCVQTVVDTEQCVQTDVDIEQCVQTDVDTEQCVQTDVDTEQSVQMYNCTVAYPSPVSSVPVQASKNPVPLGKIYKMSLKSNKNTKSVGNIASVKNRTVGEISQAASASPQNLFQAGFIQFLKEQGINTQNDRKTPEQVQTVSSSSEHGTPVSNSQLSFLEHSSSNEQCKCSKDSVQSNGKTCVLESSVEENRHPCLRSTLKTDNNFKCQSMFKAKEINLNSRKRSPCTPSPLSKNNRNNKIPRLEYNNPSSDNVQSSNSFEASIEDENTQSDYQEVESPHCVKCTVKQSMTSPCISINDKHSFGVCTTPVATTFHDRSEDLSPCSFYSCCETPQLQTEKLTAATEGTKENFQSWKKSPTKRQETRTGGSSAGSVVEDSDSTSDFSPYSPTILPSSYSVEQYEAVCGELIMKTSLPQLFKHLKHPNTKLCIVKLYRNKNLDKVCDENWYEIYS